MTEVRARFDAATQSAVHARDAAESELVRDLATQIRCDPAGFDPSRLRHLGHESLRALLEGVEVTVNGDAALSPKPYERADRSVSGWAGLRRREPSHWWLEVLIATLVGLAVFFAGVLLLSLLP